jgi:hypothetical protein
MKLRSDLLAGATAIALAATAFSQPANATLQLSIDVNGVIVTCADGASCDQSGANKNLLVIDTIDDGVTVQVTLAQSTFGDRNTLQLSSSNIINSNGTAASVILLASDTGFDAPTKFISDSASLTFNANIGALPSTLRFWADPANVQGANPTNTPGTLLESVSGTATTDPDSFSGSNSVMFLAGMPFSMTEGAALSLRAGGSITGFNQSMTSGVPEPKTWAMLAMGFIALAAMRFKKHRTNRLASI